MRFNQLNKEEKKNYRNVHYKIRSLYGKAKKCENPDCEGKSFYYDWAHIHGTLMESDIKNFQQLCKSCHRKYDRDEMVDKKWKESMQKARDEGRCKISKEGRKNIDEGMKKYRIESGHKLKKLKNNL